MASQPKQRRKADTHPCRAVACAERVPAHHLMCPRHYDLIPKYLQGQLAATWRWGQEHGKVPASTAWLDAADRAIAAVAELEAAAA